MSGHAPAVIAEYTPNVDPETVLLNSLLDREEYGRAADLCREKKMLARDTESCVWWAKDGSIVEALQGNYGPAYDQLTAVYFIARQLRGRVRAKYEDALGLVLVEFNRTALALDHFGISRDNHKADGYMRGCAAVDHNAGRAYAVRGEHVKAMEYFRKALDFARATDDYRLEREVLESIFEFGVGDR